MTNGRGDQPRAETLRPLPPAQQSRSRTASLNSAGAQGAPQGRGEPPHSPLSTRLELTDGLLKMRRKYPHVSGKQTSTKQLRKLVGATHSWAGGEWPQTRSPAAGSKPCTVWDTEDAIQVSKGPLAT